VTRVFIDTSAFVALLDRADPRHAGVRDAFLGLADDDLVTHGYVVAESLAVVRRRFGVEGAMTLIDDLLPVCEVLPVEPSAHAEALARYRASLPAGTSFVDQISLGLMQTSRIDAALALDLDLGATGIRLLPTPPSSGSEGE